MSLRTRVAEAIQNEYPGTLTNNQLAIRLGENQPSVRRITRQLCDAGTVVDTGGGYGSQPVEYRGMPPVADSASASL